MQSSFKIFSFAIALLSALPVPALADPGWSAPLTIQSVIPTESDLILVVSGNNNPLGCSLPNWTRISRTEQNYELISATILTAFAQSKPIKLWQKECIPDGYVHFTAAWIDR